MTTPNPKILGRQHQIRVWLLQEMEYLPIVMAMDDLGKYAKYRWYRFGQTALFKNGSLLNPDSQWGTIEQEMQNWPMMKWLSVLENDTIIEEAKNVYNTMDNGQLTITVHTAEGAMRPFQLNRLTWASMNAGLATPVQIWKWLGPVGGELPPRPM